MGEDDSGHRAYNILNAALVAYAVTWLVPTAFSSLCICLKEPFMNPIAWSKEEEYQEGYLWGLVDLDVLSWFGIEDNNKLYYYNWLQRQTTQFL